MLRSGAGVPPTLEKICEFVYQVKDDVYVSACLCGYNISLLCCVVFCSVLFCSVVLSVVQSLRFVLCDLIFKEREEQKKDDELCTVLKAFGQCR